MWLLLAIVLSAIVLFYLFAFYISVVAWLNAIGHLLKGNFARAAAWACIGGGMILWWQGEDTIPDPWAFHEWLKTSAIIVGIGALVSSLRWLRKQRAMQTIPTMSVWTPPKTPRKLPANDNLVVFSLHAKIED